MKVPTSRAPAPKQSTIRWAWAVLQLMRSRGWLRPKRIGSALLMLVVIMFVTMWLVGRAVDGIASSFGNSPASVPGGPYSAYPSAAPARPASSGSATIDRIRGRGRLIVAIQESPGFSQRSSSSGGYTGFDIALLEVIAHDLGVDPARTSFKPLPPSSREGALLRGEADLIIGGFEIPAADPSVSTAGPYLVRSGTEYGIGLAPGDPVLHDRITAVLRRAIDDGTWARLYRQYFGAAPPSAPVLR
jgi:polar amino acid transport system substrate-binding protein